MEQYVGWPAMKDRTNKSNFEIVNINNLRYKYFGLVNPIGAPFGPTP